MAASSSRGGADRMIHQDYIARIRYSNTLPPPPNPPKLLDIPNTGLASGQYTAPGFASRLAREQPLNIEADAELGMPLDLVGMPGIFDGDESSIQAPLHPPAPHPHDRALLRPLSSLGKPKSTDSGVSFLRRTEYISSHTGRSRFDSTTSRSLIHSTGGRQAPRKPPTKVDKESPEYIKEQVERSFEVTAQNLKDPAKIRHPTKPGVKLLESYPLLPDLDAIPEIGAYVGIKFLTNPVAPSNTYDIRLSNGIIRSIGSSAAREQAHEEATAAHLRDPDRYPEPEPLQDFEFFTAFTPEDALTFKRKFDIYNPDAHDVEYPNTNMEGAPCFRFKRLRAYETASIMGDPSVKYDEEVVIAINDGKDGNNKQPAAYYYPVAQRFAIRPQRKKNIDSKRYGFTDPVEEGVDSADFIDFKVRDADEREQELRKVYITDPYYDIPDDANDVHVGESVKEQGIEGDAVQHEVVDEQPDKEVPSEHEDLESDA